MTSEDVIFLTARAATDRGALARYKQAEGVDENNDAAVREATARYRELPLLLDPNLVAFATTVLHSCCGPLVDGNRRFPATLWFGGATATRDGRDFLGTVSEFVMLLEERATKFAAKREGWVVEPTTNTDGHRTNASTASMHAVFLDCDGRGTWNRLLAVLHELGYAYIAYQSGGWSPTTPKWRVVLILAQPFDTSDENKQVAWKNLYNHLRVVIGSVAGLVGEGFDPATDTPCCPWFLTERRDNADSPRQVLWHAGHSLDVMSLILALPPVEVSQIQHAERAPVSGEGLSDEKLNDVIDALSTATASVPSGRHDLYLALPGVLLDRGVPPDEVLAIIEAVSASYPRSHPGLHADNVHNARTTIGKWEAGGHVTRIGTLNDRWPNVAQALDVVLPDPLSAMLQASTAAMIAEQVPLIQSTTGETVGAIAKKKRRKLSALGKEILPIVTSMKKSSNARRRYGATLIDRILDGEPFQGGSPAEVDVLVNFTAETLGYNLPLTTTWHGVLDLAHKTLLSMDFTQSVERVAAAEAAFLKGQRKKRKWISKNNTEIETKRKHSRDLLNAARILTKDNR